MKHVNKRRLCIAFVMVFMVTLYGCASRNNVSVIDAVTRKPIVGAKVTPIYPSFGGKSYETNTKGVAHLGGFGIPRDGYGVEVTAPGYEKYFFGTNANSENQPRWNGHNLDVELTPTQP